jgi:hypothetical protein
MGQYALRGDRVPPSVGPISNRCVFGSTHAIETYDVDGRRAHPPRRGSHRGLACKRMRRPLILTADDVTYLTSIIDQVGAARNVDLSRVYVMGHSNGGFMSCRQARIRVPPPFGGHVGGLRRLPRSFARDRGACSTSTRRCPARRLC